jgi:tRNA(fMet)-specific endonuclease VapC
MLDTNICIYIIKKKPEQVLRRLKNARISDIGVSSITLSELEKPLGSGLHSSHFPERPIVPNPNN